MDELYEELKCKALKKREQTLKEMGKGVKTTINKPLTPMELKVYDRIFKQNIPQNKVAIELSCSASNIHQIVNRIKKKIDISHENKEKKVD